MSILFEHVTVLPMDGKRTALKDAFRKKFDGEADYYSGAVASMNLYHGGWE